MTWTKEREERLPKLVKDGLSASQIAAALGGGLTRSAIIGKCQRLGISLGGKSGAPTARKLAQPARNADAFHKQQTAPRATLGRQLPVKEIAPPPALAPIPAPIAEPLAAGVTLLELRRHHCRWPLWGHDERPDEPRYCGAVGADMAADPARPYCAHHAAIASGKGTPIERAATKHARRAGA